MYHGFHKNMKLF